MAGTLIAPSPCSHEVLPRQAGAVYFRRCARGRSAGRTGTALPGRECRRDTILHFRTRGETPRERRPSITTTPSATPSAGRGGARNPKEPDVDHGIGLIPGRRSPPLPRRPRSEGAPAPPRPIRGARGADLPSGSGSVPSCADFRGDRRSGPPAASRRVDFTADSSCPGSQCARSDPGTAARFRSGSPGSLRSPPGTSIAAPLRRPHSRRPLRRALTAPGWGSSFCFWPPWWR